MRGSSDGVSPRDLTFKKGGAADKRDRPVGFWGSKVDDFDRLHPFQQIGMFTRLKPIYHGLITKYRDDATAAVNERDISDHPEFLSKSEPNRTDPLSDFGSRS